ncbi:MAG: MIP/aquaporin family protein [Pirellulales bacterium]
MNQSKPTLAAACTAELIGTFLLIFLGCGAVNAAVAYGAQSGVWQVAIVWGIGVMLAVYAIGSISGAHLNPAITVAMAAWRGFPKSQVLPYIGSQVVGAFLAAAVLFFIFNAQLSEIERVKKVVRGEAGSEITATAFCEFYPAPGGLAVGKEPYSAAEHAQMRARVPHHVAFFAEVIGTMILAIVVFAVSDERNGGSPQLGTAPLFIGLTVAGLISVIGPVTQACLNPARDFGPRLFTAAAGWGTVVLPGADGFSWLTVYIIAPIVGAVIGGGIQTYLIRPLYPVQKG